jgi:tetrahydromethanopterin S-methyltransferase subunit A
MSYQLVYSAVREHPRKVIHVVRVVGALLDAEDIDQLSARMRQHVHDRHGEPDAAAVVVQGEAKETLRLFGDSYSVARVRAAMFNAAIAWQDFAME